MQRQKIKGNESEGKGKEEIESLCKEEGRTSVEYSLRNMLRP